MKKEWTEKDFNKVNSALSYYFGGKAFINHRNENVLFPYEFKGIENILGLPYTSTSKFAMYSLDCNVHICYPRNIDYYYSHVGITDKGTILLYLWDTEENEMAVNITI